MTSQFSRNDEYGFIRPDSFDFLQYEKFMKTYLRVLSNRAQKWDKITQKGYGKLERGTRLKRYIRKGIPSSHRKEIWMEVSGASKLKREESDLYFTMLAIDTDESVLEQIRTDLPRTFPNNINFDSTNPNSMQIPLLNVLKAFANNNPSIGYCQGLNYIAGLLLLVTKDEDSSFWLLKVLVEKLLPDYYSPSMPGLLTDVKVMSELARKEVPALARHVDAMQVPWALICSKWFICLYAEVMPIETVLRVWDCLFSEGSKILFRVALAVFKSNEKSLLAKKDLASLIDEFKMCMLKDNVVDCHTCLEDVFKLSQNLSRSRIDQLRLEFGTRVREEQIEREKRRKSNNQNK